jgi:hypothetical protein
MKQARDLFLLSAIAYRQGKYDDSATLFATAMSSDDVEQFLEVLNEEQTVTSSSLLSPAKEIESSLEQAIGIFSTSLNTAIETEDEELVFPATSETDLDESEDFDDDEENSSDVSSFPGQTIIPSSLSNEEKSKSRKIVISSSINSPVKLRA